MAGVPRAAVVAVALPQAGASDTGARTLRRDAGTGRAVWRRPGRRRYQCLGRPAGDQRHPARRGDRPAGPCAGTARKPAMRSWSPARWAEACMPAGTSAPEPRIAEALALHEAAPLHAMIDISDGLSSDLSHILAESGGLGAVLDETAIPIHPDAHEMSQTDGVSRPRSRAQRRRGFRALRRRARGGRRAAARRSACAGQALPDRRNHRGAGAQASFSRRRRSDRSHRADSTTFEPGR